MHKYTKKVKNINLMVCLNSLKLKTKRLMAAAFVVCPFFLPTGQNGKKGNYLNCAGLPVASMGKVMRKAFKKGSWCCCWALGC